MIKPNASLTALPAVTSGTDTLKDQYMSNVPGLTELMNKRKWEDAKKRCDEWKAKLNGKAGLETNLANLTEVCKQADSGFEALKAELDRRKALNPFSGYSIGAGLLTNPSGPIFSFGNFYEKNGWTASASYGSSDIKPETTSTSRPQDPITHFSASGSKEKTGTEKVFSFGVDWTHRWYQRRTLDEIALKEVTSSTGARQYHENSLMVYSMVGLTAQKSDKSYTEKTNETIYNALGNPVAAKTNTVATNESKTNIKFNLGLGVQRENLGAYVKMLLGSDPGAAIVATYKFGGNKYSTPKQQRQQADSYLNSAYDSQGVVIRKTGNPAIQKIIKKY
jgi:hypothetical protein